MSTQTSTAGATYTPPSPRAALISAFEREYATTRRVLEHFPPSQAGLKPSEKSNSAQQLLWTFAIEATLGLLALQGKLELGKGFPKGPETWDETMKVYEQGTKALVEYLKSMPDAALNGTTKFFVAPKTIGDIPTTDFLWFMLHDHIHHRGQLTVYSRIAGAKVPSIYGPSADEPWM